MKSGVKDKNGREIKAGDVLKDSWHGFLYRVVFVKAAFVLVGTGERINEKSERVKSWLPAGTTSTIYSNFNGFSKRHEIVEVK